MSFPSTLESTSIQHSQHGTLSSTFVNNNSPSEHSLVDSNFPLQSPVLSILSPPLIGAPPPVDLPSRGSRWTGPPYTGDKNALLARRRIRCVTGDAFNMYMKHSSTALAHPGEIPSSNLRELPAALFCTTPADILQGLEYQYHFERVQFFGRVLEISHLFHVFQAELEDLMRQRHNRLIICQAAITRYSLVLNAITLLWASLRESLPPVATGYKGYGPFARLGSYSACSALRVSEYRRAIDGLGSEVQPDRGHARLLMLTTHEIIVSCFCIEEPLEHSMISLYSVAATGPIYMEVDEATCSHVKQQQWRYIMRQLEDCPDQNFVITVQGLDRATVVRESFVYLQTIHGNERLMLFVFVVKTYTIHRHYATRFIPDPGRLPPRWPLHGVRWGFVVNPAPSNMFVIYP